MCLECLNSSVLSRVKRLIQRKSCNSQVKLEVQWKTVEISSFRSFKKKTNRKICSVADFISKVVLILFSTMNKKVTIIDIVIIFVFKVVLIGKISFKQEKRWNRWHKKISGKKWFGAAKNRTRDFSHAKRTLYRWATAPQPNSRTVEPALCSDVETGSWQNTLLRLSWNSAKMKRRWKVGKKWNAIKENRLGQFLGHAAENVIGRKLSWVLD